MTADRACPTPSFAQAALCFGGVLALLSMGLFVFAVSLHSLMFLALVWVGAHARWLGHDYRVLRQMMGSAISQALPAIYIFILIGMVIASFMQAGTIAALVYHGLGLLAPSGFLVAGLILCSLMSVATGTSWGTAGTLGVVLMGVGGAMGVPLPLVAGTVVAGATFGDKLSPVSDTTNLAAMAAGTDLYRHIRSMLYTTLPTYGLTLLILLGFGLSLSAEARPAAEIDTLRSALANHYGLHLLPTLAPLVVMGILSLRRVAAEVTMSAAVLTACGVAVLYQGQDLAVVLNALWQNTAPATGIDNLDQLLGRGGIYSMAWTLLLALMALALGGMLHEAGFLNRLLSGLVARIHHTGALVAATIGGGLAGNLAMGEAYISILLNCQLLREQYQHRKIDPAVLSRSVEEGATLTTGLIPWTTAGAFYAATLGVPVLDYGPYAFLNYLNAPVAIVMASLGIGLLRGRHTD